MGRKPEHATPWNHRAIAAIKGLDRPKTYGFDLGLMLLVSPAGTKTWRFDYTVQGKRRSQTLGRFPEVGLEAVSAAHARARELVAQGIDPVEHQRQAELQEKLDREGTFGAYFAKLMDDDRQRGFSASTLGKRQRQADLYLLPALGAMPVKTITRADVATALDTCAAPYTRNRLRWLAATVLDRARMDGAIVANPADANLFRIPVPPVRSQPALTQRAAFSQFLRDLYAREEGRTELATQLAVLTFTRPGELRLARWEHIARAPDPELGGAYIWSVPAEVMKTGADDLPAFQVPLSRQARAVLARLRRLSGAHPSGLIFPGQGAKNPEMSENTITKMLWGMGYKGRQSHHGFRASARSLMTSAGYPEEVMELCLDHKPGDATKAAYARDKRLDERARFMQAWADQVDRMRSPKVLELGEVRSA